MQSQITQLPENFKNEFQITEDGKTSCSQRGLGRLCGVSDVAILKTLKKCSANQKLPESLQRIAGKEFGSANLILDLDAACVIEYYAFDAGRWCTQQAKSIFRAFAAIGFRTWVQQELGWKPFEIRYRRQGKNLWRDERTGQWYIQHYNEFKEINSKDAENLEKRKDQMEGAIEQTTKMLEQMLQQRRLDRTA
jgi:hypothetical protein